MEVVLSLLFVCLRSFIFPRSRREGTRSAPYLKDINIGGICDPSDANERSTKIVSFGGPTGQCRKKEGRTKRLTTSDEEIKSDALHCPLGEQTATTQVRAAGNVPCAKPSSHFWAARSPLCGSNEGRSSCQQGNFKRVCFAFGKGYV